MKQLTGGDVIRARHLYQGSFEFRPQFALWLVCNRTPVVAHDDDAMWRRILRLPFENKIPAAKQDKTLKSILTDMSLTGSAILAWAVQGCVEWYQHGLQVPPIVERATKSYQIQSNPLADFVLTSAFCTHPRLPPLPISARLMRPRSMKPGSATCWAERTSPGHCET